ncbi:hypothetical protein, partial [Methylobacterium sp. WL7]|uniref:hypothetical protein n=1 Tax=Methylobacterium sp. WL7 TaxID=2603900 RepID=UPI001AEDF6C4
MTKRPALSTNAPAWEDFESADVKVRRSWLSYIDMCFDKLFLEGLNESALNDREFEQYMERYNIYRTYSKAQLSDSERNALLLGMTSPSDHVDRWKQLATVIREHGTSIELNEILSEMIEYGG